MEYSNNFKKVIKQAEMYSKGLIDPSHLFSGLISVKESKGYAILSKMIDIVDAERKMKEILGDIPESDPTEKRVSRLTIEAENIMMQSQLEAKKFHSEKVCTEHLLLAMSRARVIDVVPYKDVEKLVTDLYDITNETSVNEAPNQSTPNKKTKTPLLDEFSTDLTKLASEGKLDPTVGRKKELRRIAQVLSRRKKNNPVLIGDPGCVIGDTLITIKKISDETNHNIIIVKNEF